MDDKKAYGKAFGKALAIVASALLFSGITALAGETEKVLLPAIIVLFAGMGIGITGILIVQKKYNKGLF